MKDKDLCQQILGIRSPWRVAEVELRVQAEAGSGFIARLVALMTDWLRGIDQPPDSTNEQSLAQLPKESTVPQRDRPPFGRPGPSPSHRQTPNDPHQWVKSLIND